MEVKASHRDADATSKNQHENHVRCSKCHALNPREAAATFCDQCGHRLRRKHRDKSRSGRRKHDDEKQPGSGKETPEIAVTTTSDGGWFWGQQAELPDLSQPHSEKESESGRVAIDNQILPPQSPKHRIQKAHTAHASGHDRRSELAHSLRRVQSFGETPSSLLPPIANLRQPHSKEPKLVAKDTTNGQLPTPVKTDASPDLRARLWGQVLAEAIVEFESTSLILTAEIDSDERCISVLAQRLHIEETSRSKYVVASGIIQLQFKHQELQKKVRINKEKLTMVQQRLRALYEQRNAEETVESEPESQAETDQEPKVSIAPQQEEDAEGDALEKPAELSKKKTKRKRKEGTKHLNDEIASAEESNRLERAAVMIQKRFRVVRARRLFVAMVKRAYQRVYDAESKRYFYYNPRTKESQWEVPQTLAKAQHIEKQQFCCRRRRAASSRSLNAAASRIQALYRRRAARLALRQMLQQVYEKVYDADSNSYYYYCKKTKTSSWEKPKLLHDSDLDETNHTATASSSKNPTNSLENDQRTSAAVKIQSLYRNRATRIFLRDLASGNIEKHFDEGVGAWYYYNHRTQESFWEQARHASLQAAMPKPKL